MKATFISRFTPSLMEHEALEATFVQREAMVQRLVELIRDSALTLSKHQALLIGPRGIGKTHVVALIYHRVRAMTDLHDRLLIAWLREDEWGVTSFLDFLLRILRAVRAEYPGIVSPEDVDSLYNLSPEGAERAAGKLLKQLVGDRTLLVLVENLNDLFDGLGDKGQKRLRAYLQESPLYTILATAQSLFNGVLLQTSPFYGFFRIYHLEELSLDDAKSLLRKIADFEGDRELASFIATPEGRARVRAIHHLAGGNHRVYVIFSQFLSRESLDELVEPFVRTLDDLTPYYQARMAWLSPQQRKVVEFLSDHRNARPVKEIAKGCFMTHQTASSQLKILREMGYVRSESIGRESYYELREPLMRMCMEVKRLRGEPIRLFVEFLRIWYSRAALRLRLETIKTDAALEKEYLLRALQATEEDHEDPRVKACMKDYHLYAETGDFARSLEAAEELVAMLGREREWVMQGINLSELGRYDEALRSFDRAIELAPTSIRAWGNRGVTFGRLGQHDSALMCFEKAIELEPKSPLAWRSRGLALAHLGRNDEALTSFDKALKFDPKSTLALIGKAEALCKLGRYDDAAALFDTAIHHQPEDAHIWFHRGLLWLELSRYDEALASFDRVIELEPDDEAGWGNRGVILARLSRYDEALASFDRVIELTPESASAWLERGEALRHLGRYDEALTSFDKALALGEEEVHIWFHRGQLWVQAGRYDEALASFDRIIELTPENVSTWGIRGLVLGELGRYDEALASIDKGITLGDKSSDAFFNRAEALLALGRWDEGSASLDDALLRFAHAEQPNTGDTEAIVRDLFKSTADTATWRKRIATLIETYKKHQVLSALGHGLVRSIAVLKPAMVGAAVTQGWLNTWQELGAQHVELQLPLRLLDAAVRHRETHDPRILLELPVEERKLLEPILELGEPHERKVVTPSTRSVRRGRPVPRRRRKPSSRRAS